MDYCPQCGSELQTSGPFCPECGSSLEAPETTPSQESAQTTAAAGPPGARRGGQPAQQRGARAPNQAAGQSTYSRRSLLLAGGGGVAALGLGAWYVLEGGKPPLEEVAVRLVDVRRPDVGFTSATIPLIVSLTNPTGTAIPDLSGDLDIYVNDQRIGSDELTVNRLEPGETTNVDLEVIVKYEESGAALVDAVRSQSFDVELRGSLNAGGASRTLTLEGSL